MNLPHKSTCRPATDKAPTFNQLRWLVLPILIGIALGSGCASDKSSRTAGKPAGQKSRLAKGHQVVDEAGESGNAEVDSKVPDRSKPTSRSPQPSRRGGLFRGGDATSDPFYTGG
jgi:hypothetical protein